MEDLSLEVTLTNPLDSTSKLIEIDYVTQEQAGMSAIMRDVAWIEKNICTIVGVALGLALLLIIVIQVTMICRHKRHGCKSFRSEKIEVKM